MSKGYGDKQTFGQKIGSFFVGLLALVVLCCAGYGIYSAIDRYALPDKPNQEQTQTPEEQKLEGETDEKTSAEYILAQNLTVGLDA